MFLIQESNKKSVKALVNVLTYQNKRIGRSVMALLQ